MTDDATCEFLSSEEFRYRLQARLKFRRDQATNLAAARAEGIAEGIAKAEARSMAIGEAKAIAGAIRSMVNYGYEPHEVAAMLHMSLEVVQSHLG